MVITLLNFRPFCAKNAVHENASCLCVTREYSCSAASVTWWSTALWWHVDASTSANIFLVVSSFDSCVCRARTWLCISKQIWGSSTLTFFILSSREQQWIVVCLFPAQPSSNVGDLVYQFSILIAWIPNTVDKRRVCQKWEIYDISAATLSIWVRKFETFDRYPAVTYLPPSVLPRSERLWACCSS